MVTSETRTEVVFLQNGTLNAHRYISGILIPHVQFVLVVTGDRSIFVDDNTRLRRAAEVSFMENISIRRLDWPGTSPDLNLIEYLWVVLKHRDRGIFAVPENLTEL